MPAQPETTFSAKSLTENTVSNYESLKRAEIKWFKSVKRFVNAKSTGNISLDWTSEILAGQGVDME